jgi:hypothetical protein
MVLGYIEGETNERVLCDGLQAPQLPTCRTERMDIRLPDYLTSNHRAAVLRFVQGRLTGDEQYAAQIEAFDWLRQATAGEATFAAFYSRVVEDAFADSFIAALLEAPDPEAATPALRQQVSRQIPARLMQAGCVQVYQPPEFYLLAYCLYWWHAFTTGYAFEVITLRDLAASGVVFDAHDLRDQRVRQSPFDLVVMGFTGDIKTSTYFLQAVRSRGLPADLYITRLFDERRRQYRSVVFLKRHTWDAIDGETRLTALPRVLDVLPAVAEIRHGGQNLVVVDYPEWKERVIRQQRLKER